MKNASLSTLQKLLLVSSFVIAPQVFAAMSPVGVGVFAPVQFPSEEVAVTGVRFNLLWGSHRRVYGADVSLLAGRTTSTFGGVLQVAGLLNYNQATATVIGLQFAGAANINGTTAKIYGVQAAAYNSNVGESQLVGLNLAALANVSPHMTILGVQAAGLYNSARTVNGLQIGLVNVADRLRGLQIGLVNIHRQGLFKICPLINFGF
jgi:hypothetical protein